MRALAVAAGLLILSGCAAFTPKPSLPQPPAGAVALTGDGAWEISYDQAVMDWHSRFDNFRPFEIQDYWLTEHYQANAVFAAYDEALSGWAATEHADSRNRWVGRSYEQGGRFVGVALLSAERHGTPYDALVVTTGPR